MSGQYFQTIHEIIKTGHWVTDQVSRELKEFGITEPQYNVLRILKTARKPISVQEILENMVQRSSNITRIVDKLIAKECVERKECPNNRRKMDISITEEGLELLKKLDEKVYNLHAPLMNNLNEDELSTLKQLIIKLKTNNNE